MAKSIANEVVFQGGSVKPRVRKYAWSFAVGLVLTLLVGALASRPRWSAVGVLLAPGMLAGAIVFPEGTKSDWPGVYMVIAELMNAFFLSWPVLGIWTLIGRVRQRNQMTGGTQ